jgi:hypothetical protein
MRIRTIKPELWTSPTIVRLSLRARLLFLGLLNYADDEGRGLADPALIRGALYMLEPEVTDEDVRSWLSELRATRLVTLYRGLPVGSRVARDLFQIRGFLEHQRVDRPRPSRYAAPRKHRARSSSSSSSRSSKRSTQEVEVEQGKGSEASARGVGDASTNASGNGAGVYDPDATYVPGPDDPKLFDEEAEPSSDPRPSPASWRTRPNPWENLEESSS